MTLPRMRRRLAYGLTAAALAAACLIVVAAVVPQRTQAAGAGDDAQAAADRCFALAQEVGPPPPVRAIPLALQVTQPSIEPVPATDGLIHLAYAVQVTNAVATPLGIAGVVPVDPLAGFAPTGRNHVVDTDLRDITGTVRLFDTSAASTLPADGPPAAGSPAPPSGYSTSVPAGGSGLMFFDLTYTDPAQVPRLLAHAVTVAVPAGEPGLPAYYGTAGYTDPVPVGCRPLAVLHPPLVGHGWFDSNGCCTIIGPHRGGILPIHGTLRAFEQFAVDYIQLGPNNVAFNGPSQALASWPSYGAPVLAVAPGVVVSVVDGMPDQQPVGTIAPDLPLTDYPGNSVVEDIGGGRYVTYAHFQPGSIPASVRAGGRLSTGDLIGRVGNSGNSTAPHLHFQVQDRPSPLDATGLPFVFDVQLLEGTVTGGDPASGFVIDRTGAGLQSNRMPVEPQVFGYDVSSQ